MGYLDHIAVERGLSTHTVQAYSRDLRRYESWCTSRGLVRVDAISANEVSDYAASLSHADYHGPGLSD